MNPKERAVNERIKYLEEVSIGFAEEEAIQEASRCLQCKDMPCVKNCPLLNNIPEILKEIKNKQLDKAYETLTKTNPMASICGRICPTEKYCEKHCLANKNEPVQIRKLERFVADNASHKNKKIKQNKKSIAIVGSGPAGLACAHELALKGYTISVFEALHKFGGFLSYGVPNFRLPEKIIEKSLEKIKNLGFEFNKNIVVGKTITIKELEKNFDAVFIATGSGPPLFMNIPGENLVGVYSANEFLIKLMHADKFPDKTPLKTPMKTAVIGGNDQAIDAARTALRLGKNVTVIYKESFVEMPASQEEIRHAKEEGVKFLLLTKPKKIIGNNGKVSAVECTQMMLGEDEETGAKKTLELENSEFIVDCDEVIIAIGHEINSLLLKELDVDKDFRGNLVVNENLQTSNPKIFAAGYLISSSATITQAIADGKKAAEKIDEFLK